MNKLILCTSPHVRHPAVLHGDFEDRAGLMYSFVPVGLLSLAAVVRQSSRYEVGLFDTNAAINRREIDPGGDYYGSAARLICALDPQVVGFMTECDSYHHVLQICEQIRIHRPDIAIILGGPHASTVAAPTLQRWSCIDAICVGEGERTILSLLDELAQPANVRIPGAVVRDRFGNVQNGGLPNLIDNLDLLPVPAFDMYLPQPGEEVFLEVGRGCPFDCTFCSTAPYWKRRHRVKSPTRIVSEIQHVSTLYGKRRFHFTHDLFTTDRRWALAVSDALAELERVPAWTCSARTDLVDRELLRRMAKGGCNAIYYGVESGSARVLSAIKKDIAWNVTRQAIEDSRDSGIQPNAGLIVGFPEDDAESVRKTFAAYSELLSMGAKPVHIFGFCPFNGATSFDAEKLDGVQTHFLDMPTPERTDTKNRQLVQSDPLLFSSYRRIASDQVKALSAGFIEGIDEFTPLIESCLLPTLAFVQLRVSILDLYTGWLYWIASKNQQHGKSPARKYYGSPAMYATYLLQRAHATANYRRDVISLLELLQHMLKGTKPTDLAPISMASFRSGVSTAEVFRRRIQEGCEVASCDFLDLIISEWDLEPLLSWLPPDDMPLPQAKRNAYAFQQVTSQEVRLLQIAPDVAELLQTLQQKPRDAASLWAEHVRSQGALTSMGVDGVVEAIVAARNAGLVRILGEV